MKTSTVTERALLQRINRKLSKHGQKMCKTRPFYDGVFRHVPTDLGDFHLVNTWTNSLDAGDVNIEALARELGCLASDERLKGAA
jgi:hypothetical protein